MVEGVAYQWVRTEGILFLFQVLFCGSSCHLGMGMGPQAHECDNVMSTEQNNATSTPSP